MTETFTAKKAVTINASPDRIWDALTEPEMIKHYTFGAEVVTDWQPGSSIVYRGVWDGKPFEDRGRILAIDPPLFLRTSYYSALSGKPDTPENYAEVTYALSRDGKASKLTVTQNNIATSEELAATEGNWSVALDTIKELVERVSARDQTMHP